MLAESNLTFCSFRRNLTESWNRHHVLELWAWRNCFRRQGGHNDSNDTIRCGRQLHCRGRVRRLPCSACSAPAARAGERGGVRRCDTGVLRLALSPLASLALLASLAPSSLLVASRVSPLLVGLSHAAAASAAAATSSRPWRQWVAGAAPTRDRRGHVFIFPGWCRAAGFAPAVERLSFACALAKTARPEWRPMC